MQTNAWAWLYSSVFGWWLALYLGFSLASLNICFFLTCKENFAQTRTLSRLFINKLSSNNYIYKSHNLSGFLNILDFGIGFYTPNLVWDKFDSIAHIQFEINLFTYCHSLACFVPWTMKFHSFPNNNLVNLQILVWPLS